MRALDISKPDLPSLLRKTLIVSEHQPSSTT
jgi:hypothetical protein